MLRPWILTFWATSAEREGPLLSAVIGSCMATYKILQTKGSIKLIVNLARVARSMFGANQALNPMETYRLQYLLTNG